MPVVRAEESPVQPAEESASGQDEKPNKEKWPSYTMVEDRFKKVYFQFYRETYRKTRLDRKTKELIAIAASVGFKCKGCLEGHIKKALEYQASKEEISESIAIAMGVAAASVVDQTDIAAESLQLLHFD